MAFASGATAAVVGFGIGSLLTPLLAASLGTSTAVAAVALPHAAATTLRCWRLRGAVDWSILGGFGLLSAVGGLVGAVLYSQLASGPLTIALGCLLLLTASAGITGWGTGWHPKGPMVWALGLLSGFFGGLAGNQGGLRAAALSAFRLPPVAFVATATAIGVLVDAARTPVYLWRAGPALQSITGLIAVATAGVLLGTIVGERLLRGLSPN
ncbi:MAG: TSUP family transporter, partial [bacterium]